MKSLIVVGVVAAGAGFLFFTGAGRRLLGRVGLVKVEDPGGATTPVRVPSVRLDPDVIGRGFRAAPATPVPPELARHLSGLGASLRGVGSGGSLRGVSAAPAGAATSSLAGLRASSGGFGGLRGLRA